MNKLLKYTDFIKESKIDNTYVTDDKKHLLLFSDTVRKDCAAQGGKFPIFYEYYGDPTVFYGLDLVGDDEIFTMRGIFRDCRFTLLTTTTYKDTDSDGNRKLTYDKVAEFLEHRDRYYFYHFVSGPRTEDKAPDREHIERVIKDNDRNWYFILVKDKNCSLVKIKSRQEGGKWAEHQLTSLHSGWNQSSHDIKAKIMKNDVVIRANGLIKQIFDSVDEDIFGVEEDPETFVKFDIVIDNDINKRLEVKKYKEKDLLDSEGIPKPILLAEQCRMAQREQLSKVVEWFNILFSNDKRTSNYIESIRLLELDDREMQKEFNLKIKENGKWVDNPYSTEIADEIRDYYNSKIEKLSNIFDGIAENKWMAGILGIYFAGDRNNRKNDFLIKIDDDGVRNIHCHWEIKQGWCGFNELKLFMTINENAWEYILTEGNNFERAFQLKDYEMHEDQRNDGEIDANGNFIYDEVNHWWVRQPAEE